MQQLFKCHYWKPKSHIIKILSGMYGSEIILLMKSLIQNYTPFLAPVFHWYHIVRRLIFCGLFFLLPKRLKKKFIARRCLENTDSLTSLGENTIDYAPSFMLRLLLLIQHSYLIPRVIWGIILADFGNFWGHIRVFLLLNPIWNFITSQLQISEDFAEFFSSSLSILIW